LGQRASQWSRQRWLERRPSTLFHRDGKAFFLFLKLLEREV